MPKNTDNPYNNPPNFAPFGNSGVGPQNGLAGSTGTAIGGPWNAEETSYGLVGQRNGPVQYGLMLSERNAIDQTSRFYRGVVQDEQAYNGGIITPQTYLRPTVPTSQESRTVPGPIAAMVFRPDRVG